MVLEAELVGWGDEDDGSEEREGRVLSHPLPLLWTRLQSSLSLSLSRASALATKVVSLQPPKEQ